MPRLSKIGAAALAAFGWTGLSSVSASALVVAGGGSGARDVVNGTATGGGGAGEVISASSVSLNPTQSYTITVGAGGASQTGGRQNGNAGSNSSLGSLIVANGGGYGACYFNVGGSGGSGGGGSGDAGTGSGGKAGGSSTTGTLGGGTHYGNAGGTGSTSAEGCGGGGGAGAVGSNGSGNNSGAGGAGTANSISGSSVTYGGGGGGGGFSGSAGAGGSGGGGAGGAAGANGTNGTANLGGGGGGGGSAVGSVGNSGSGGSGVVIISYPAPQQFGGGVVTTSGSNVIHTFNTSGTLSPLSSLTASYLIVAGGGAGARHSSAAAGGGGAGGLLSGSGLTIDTNSNYVVTVGAGGTIAADFAAGGDGTNSTFSMVTTSAVGGGGGGAQNSNGRTGGSGGGGTYTGGLGGSGTAGQGNNGGAVISGNSGGGGGGGAGAVGSNAASGTTGGNGGNGTASSISGSSVTYAGGGGGGTNGGTPGSGGTGGGGTGANASGGNATAGTANLGGGGGGAGYLGGTAGAGGSGVVIISYAGSTQQMAGGTVTITGGNVIHTFTSSGYLTPIKYVNNSLRFRSSNSAYLSRTPTVSGNQQKFTFSYWFKRGTLSAQQVMFGINSASNEIFTLTFLAGDTFRVFGRNGGTDVLNLTTTAVYRDPAAWYHIVVAIDTTQATSSNRALLYINGVQVTAFGTATYPAQNTSLAWDSSSYAHNIGRESTGNYIDGEMTETNFIDGQQLTPSSFGTFNSYGVWQPITYGGSYGTNGFYLPFKTNASSYVGSFSSSYLSATQPAAFGTGTFTVEGYFNATANTNYGNIFSTQLQYDAGTGGLRISVGGSGTNKLQVATYLSGLMNSSVAFTLGTWNHFAYVRTSSVGYLYLNGILVASAADTTNYTTTQFVIGNLTGTGGPYYFSGQISNIRAVTGVAVYTSNFVPPTSALTAISGTQLLTLQNSSIVDNSSYALSITNTGGVTTGQTYPFAYGIFNDQGPAGNNWTPNNISGVTGTTQDYMTDVPTLTSATAANFCTLNPLDTNTSPTITNGNLNLASTGATWKTARSTISLPLAVGKFYMELSVTANSNDCEVGFCLQSQTLAEPFTMATCVAYSFGSGNKYVNGSSTAYGASVAIGDTVGVAYDTDAGTITFYKNNSSQGAITTGWGAGFYSFVYSLYGRSGGTTSGWVNFGQQPFVYTPPTGFVALNTYNL